MPGAPKPALSLTAFQVPVDSIEVEAVLFCPRIAVRIDLPKHLIFPRVLLR